MEAKIDEQLIPFLLRKGIQYHSQHNFRYGCECNYCISKRAWTRRVAHVKVDGIPICAPYVHDIEDLGWRLHQRVVQARRLEIKKARKHLAELLQE